MSSINDKYSIAGRYRTVRKHLDTLGYKQALSLDSLPLIELLLVDLAETREAMKHYQAIAQNKIVACSEVYPEIDPYTCNNSKLVQECNQLHLELIEAKEENQKLSNDLKKKIRRLESELNDLQASFVKNLQRIKQLETESAEKSKKILELTGKCCKPSVSNANLADRKRSAYPLRRPVLHADPLPPSPKKSINSSCITFTSNKVEPYMVDFVSMADRRINDMTKQVSDLKEELHDNSEIIESLKSKLSGKEKEISRLRKVLEEGRLYTSDNKNDHCYSESEKSSRYNKEQLLSEKMNLEHQLKESLEKQHEAMTKALNMAKRNEELENQLRCADRMALNAEADCNLTVKENNKRVCKLQKKLEDLMTQVHTLKSELTIQSREAQELRADLEACRLEKTNVQRILENTLEEKKQMTDKFNQLTMTADRLSSGSRCYKEVNENNMPGECMCRKETEDGSNDKLIHEKNIIIDSLQTTIERIESERDHYKCEYFKFKELFKKDADKDDNDLWSQVCELRAQISEKEHTISKLTREKRELVNEKFGLKSKIHTLENHQKRNISPTRTCFCDSVTHGEKLSTSSKSKLERVERERDLAKADVERLIQERDSLRERLQIASASQMSEIRRMCTKLTDTEARFEICDRERRELLIAQGGRKAALQGMDEKFDDLKEELKRTKQELTEQRTQYFQLRTLQDQTDHALSDIQGQLAQTESELSTAIERCKSFERQHQQRDNQIKELQQEIMTHKSRMAQIDRDKDQLLIELDEKTEKIAALEREIVFKETQVNSLEQQVRDVSHNKQLCLEQANEMEHHTRSLQLELENLQRQLQSANLERDTTMQEAHRLADDLASISCELRTTRSELEASKAEVQDLKRQLQTYVSEVRRAEELIGQKENERTEMLNHFRSLSLEASALENNNHSLETEAAEARSALQSARDLVTDLERQLSDKDVLVRGYENQIIELTQSVASLEIQVQQSEDQRLHLQDELRTVRTLCVTLEQQKDSLDKKLDEAIERKTELELQLDRYRTEQDIFHDQMNKDHMMIDRLEKLLEESRKETATAQCNQRELQSEITRLKYKISDMQSKLSAETSELRKYQTQASEYGKQISELRRQVTNERYERAKLQDNHSSVS